MKALPIPDRSVPEGLGVLGVHDLMQLLGVRRTAIWKLRQRPDFPKPVKLTRRLCGWRAIDIQCWLEQQTKEGVN